MAKKEIKKYAKPFGKKEKILNPKIAIEYNSSSLLVLSPTV